MKLGSKCVEHINFLFGLHFRSRIIDSLTSKDLCISVLSYKARFHWVKNDENKKLLPLKILIVYVTQYKFNEKNNEMKVNKQTRFSEVGMNEILFLFNMPSLDTVEIKFK